MVDFAVFVLTHGRPNNIKTIKTLAECGYTGPTYLIVDDLDKCKDEYLKKYPSQVVVFDKRAAAEHFDSADNFGETQTITHARNACFKIARELKIKHFIQLDDDYTCFEFRFNKDLRYQRRPIRVKNIDAVFKAMTRFLQSTGAKSVAMAQGGDFIGGHGCEFAKQITIKRKCMNSFVCSTENPVCFLGTFNEDVNTYTLQGSRGELFFTTNHVSLVQGITQKNKGGITDLYKKYGTYVKAFYTVIHQPSSVKVKEINGGSGPRMHHSVSWRNTVPMILREEHKKNAK